MATRDGEDPATLDGPAKKRGGCLNLGWGCLPLLVGGPMFLPLGLWLN